MTFGLALLLAVSSRAETVKDREGAVRGDRDRFEQDTQWVYNNWEKGFQIARATGKPMMVVLRCVPCLACMGIDTQVLLADSTLKPLMEQFVRVRVINANDLDLTRFQFDPDLSFSVLFFNGDGTVYGRYGSWDHQRDPQNRATAGFRRALESVLAIHRAYPANKASLAGKQGKPSPYRTPVEMPTLKTKYRADLDWEGKVVQSCVHCHQIGDAIRSELRDAGQGIPDRWIYPYPDAAVLGMTFGDNHDLRIARIEAGSIASNAGLQPGDELARLDGQPVISAADVAWVLHHAPDSGRLTATVRRASREHEASLLLREGWRTRYDISRRVGTWPMRAMAFGGMKLEDLPDDEREAHKLGGEDLALLIRHVGKYGKHAAAMRAGFRAGDILVEVDGSTRRRTESRLLGELIRKHKPGDKVDAVILRQGKRRSLQIPVQ